MGDARLITVHWPSHHQVFVDGVWSSFLQNFKVDVEVTCNGQHLKAHQLILAIFCPTLVSKSDCQVFNLDHASLQGDDMDLLLEFIYRGKITLQEDRLDKLQKAAKDLGVIGLEEAIEGFKTETEETRSPASGLWEDGGEGEQQRNRRGANRRKRKNTPFKISQQTYDRRDDSRGSGGGASSEEGDSSTSHAATKHFRPDESENNNDTDSNSDRKYDEDGGWDDSCPLPERDNCDEAAFQEETAAAPAPKRKPRRRRGAKGAVDGERGPSEQLTGEDAKAARTEYKKMWRQNQPLKKCSFCSYETRDRDSYKSHIAKHDPYAERHVCAFCSKTFRSRRGFLRHQSAHVDPTALQKCSQCDFLTPQKSSLVQHAASVHKTDLEGNPIAGKFKCAECDFSSLFECQLKLHVLRKHSHERPFKCDECDYGAVLKTDLDKHVSIKHRHERNFLCDLCGFSSSSKGGHNRHKRSHTGEKPFECDICGKKYADSRKFKIHRMRHENDEKPFVCHICSHACRRKDNLKMHLKRIHKTDDCGPSAENPSVVPEPQTIVIVGTVGAAEMPHDVNEKSIHLPTVRVIDNSIGDREAPEATEEETILAVESANVAIQTLTAENPAVGPNSNSLSEPASSLDTEALSESVAFYLYAASQELEKDCSM